MAGYGKRKIAANRSSFFIQKASKICLATRRKAEYNKIRGRRKDEKMDIWIGKDLEKRYQNKRSDNWMEQLKENGCRIFFGNLFQTEKKKGKMLCITDSKIELESVKKRGFPCIYVETEKEGEFIYGAELVAEEAEDLTKELCQSVYRRFYQIPSVVSETPRLILRETVPKDTEELYRIYEGEMYLDPLPEDPEEEKRILASYFRNMYGIYGYGIWSVIEKESGKLIGRAGIENGEKDQKGILELGYLIGKQWRRKGYAYEAAKAVIRYAQENTTEEKMYMRIHRENIPSLKLAQKLGFEKISEERICLFCKKLERKRNFRDDKKQL